MKNIANFASYTEGDEIIKMIIQNVVAQNPGNWVVYVKQKKIEQKPLRPILTKSEVDMVVERRVNQVEQIMLGGKPIEKTEDYEHGRQMIKDVFYELMNENAEIIDDYRIPN